jgi:hypothetical protein
MQIFCPFTYLSMFNRYKQLMAIYRAPVAIVMYRGGQNNGSTKKLTEFFPVLTWKEF